MIGPMFDASEEARHNEQLAGALREAGHTITPLKSVRGYAAKMNAPAEDRFPKTRRLLEQMLQAGLEEALFQYDAIVVNGNADAGRVVAATEGRPVILWDRVQQNFSPAGETSDAHWVVESLASAAATIKKNLEE